MLGLWYCGGKRDAGTQCVALPHRLNRDTQMQPTRGWVRPKPREFASPCAEAILPRGHCSLGGGEREARHKWKLLTTQCGKAIRIGVFILISKPRKTVGFAFLCWSWGESEKGRFAWS